MRPSPGVWGNKGTMAFISGEQWNKGLKMKGTEKMKFWVTGNIGNQDVDFRKQGGRAIYFKVIREQLPTPPPLPLAYHIVLAKILSGLVFHSQLRDTEFGIPDTYHDECTFCDAPENAYNGNTQRHVLDHIFYSGFIYTPGV